MQFRGQLVTFEGSGLLFADGDGVAEVHGAAAFADVVAVPGGNLDFDVAFDHALAAEARAQGESGGHVEPVGFIVVHLGQIFHAVFHDDVAGGAGAVASAGVFELDAGVEADIEEGFGLAVLVVRQLAVLEFYLLTVDGDLGQISL